MVIYVRRCPYDLDFLCNIGCEKIQDKPGWCTHRLDFYEEALELEKRENSTKETIEDKTDPFNSNFSQFQSIYPF